MPKKEYPYQNLSLKDMKGEVWEDFPGLDGVYLISNFGRIKSLRRWIERNSRGYWIPDRIIKCAVYKQILPKTNRTTSYLVKTITYNGKCVSIRIARNVYYLFVKKFELHNRSVIVTYKDEDSFNIRPSNLLLTNQSDSGRKSYKKNLRPRNAFGNIPVPVSQYDQQGNFLNSFSSISEAVQKTGINVANIHDALYNKINLRCGFIWKPGNNKPGRITVNAATRKKIAVKKNYSTCISQYDFSGNKIKTHENVKKAADKAGCASYSIMKVVLNKAFSVRGFYWKSGNGPKKIDLQHILEKRSEKLRKSLCRAVIQYDLNGKRIKKYNSLTEAQKATKISSSYIGAVAAGKFKSAKGYCWKFI